MSLAPDKWVPTEPDVHYEGPVAFHTQRCSVLTGEPAVLNMSLGVFEPSWKAQKDGWHLVKVDSWLKRVAYWLIFHRGLS